MRFFLLKNENSFNQNVVIPQVSYEIIIFWNVGLYNYLNSGLYWLIIIDNQIYVSTNINTYRASHIILDYLQSLTPKYAHNTQKI